MTSLFDYRTYTLHMQNSSIGIYLLKYFPERWTDNKWMWERKTNERLFMMIFDSSSELNLQFCIMIKMIELIKYLQHSPTNSASNAFDSLCFLDDNSFIPNVYLKPAILSLSKRKISKWRENYMYFSLIHGGIFNEQFESHISLQYIIHSLLENGNWDKDLHMTWC